ncbi:MAG: metalloendopeptidase [Bdellovibrionota bacterium]
MEDFEFKPLAKGLGFHQTKKQVEETSPEEIPTEIQWATKSMESRGMNLLEEEFTPPLPRTANPPQKLAVTENASTAPTLDELIKNLEKNRLPTEKANINQKVVAEKLYASATISWGAGFLDGMLILALTLISFITLLSITNVDLVQTWTMAYSPMLAISSVAVLIMMGFVYYSVHRIFLGATPGEWAYEQQLGLPKDLDQPSYQAKIILRSFLNVITGFLFFPILAALTGTDLLGSITGAQLYQRR